MVSEQTPDSRTLCRLGICSLMLYSALAVFFWTTWSFKARWTDEAVFIMATAALVFAYFYGLKVARRANSTIVISRTAHRRDRFSDAHSIPQTFSLYGDRVAAVALR
jgi:hypothetical protein